MLEQNDIDALKCAGLSLNQARVYLALLSTGRSTLKVISKVSEIDRANTSRTVAALEKLALVKKTLAVPNVYESISIKDAIDVLLEEKSEQYLEVQVRTKALVERFGKPKLQSKMVADDSFTVVPGKTPYIKVALSLWRSAKHTIDVVSSARRISVAKNIFAPEAKQALERGVAIRLIQDVTLGDADLIAPRRVAHCKASSRYRWEERYTVNSAVTGLLFDRKVALIAVDPTSLFAKSPGLVTNNACFVKVLQFYFDGLWNSADLVESKNAAAQIALTYT